MTTSTSTPISHPTTSNPNATRRRLLRIHSAILLLVASASALYATAARIAGIGVYGFLQQNPLVWTGLIQAYLLMLIIAGLMWLGAGDVKVRRWDVVGALAHVPPLIAVIFSWSVFTLPGLGAVAIFSLVFHTTGIAIETIAALYPDPKQS